MKEKPIITDDARKPHGKRQVRLADKDILHAYNHVIRPGFPDDEGFTINVGGDRSGNRLLEIGFTIADDGTPVIIHAMVAREQFLR